MNDKSLILVFLLLNAVHPVIVEVAINIDDDGNGDGRLGGSNTNGKESEEETVELSGIEHAVESCEVDVNGIEDQLSGNEHGNQIATRDESEHANEEQKCTKHKETLYWYHDLTPFLK